MRRTTLLKKLNRILSIALIVTLMGVGILWVVSREQIKSHTPQTPSSQEEGVSGGVPETSVDKTEHSSPDSRKFAQIAESQEFQDFMATQSDGADGLLRFFKSQGVEAHYKTYLSIFTDMFQAQFPGEQAAALEPYMRERLAVLAREMADSSVPGISESEFFEDIIVKFLIEEQNIGWLMTYFEGDFFQAARWARGIIRNPILPPTQPTDTFTVERTSTLPKRKQLDIGSEPLTAPQGDQTSLSNSGSSAPEGVGTGIENGIDVDSPSTPTTIEFSIQASVQNALRERFSPERFNRAVQILNQHGPKEGMRRLKGSDPEIAKQLERSIQKEQEAIR